MQERQALEQIEELLVQFLNRRGEPNEQLVHDALGIAATVLAHSSQSEASWVTSPDRMGGQFTEQEINARNNWI
jgi:hypothetical protein